MQEQLRVGLPEPRFWIVVEQFFDYGTHLRFELEVFHRAKLVQTGARDSA
jgi:hypothetical protein